MELPRLRDERLPFICELNFTAAGGTHGDIIQVCMMKITMINTFFYMWLYHVFWIFPELKHTIITFASLLFIYSKYNTFIILFSNWYIKILFIGITKYLLWYHHIFIRIVLECHLLNNYLNIMKQRYKIWIQLFNSQITIDGFSVGKFCSYITEGCPDGWLQISEVSRTSFGGMWCGSMENGPVIFYSETRTVILSLKLLRYAN